MFILWYYFESHLRDKTRSDKFFIISINGENQQKTQNSEKKNWES